MFFRKDPPQTEGRRDARPRIKTPPDRKFYISAPPPPTSGGQGMFRDHPRAFFQVRNFCQVRNLTSESLPHTPHEIAPHMNRGAPQNVGALGECRARNAICELVTHQPTHTNRRLRAKIIAHVARTRERETSASSQ